jgi:chromosome segregation ATPase
MAKIRSKQLADFVSSYNSATASIDILSAFAVSTEISAANTALSGAIDASIDSLELRAESVESINVVQTASIDALDTRVSDAEGDIIALDTRVSDAEGDIIALDTRVSDAEGDITTLQGDLGALDTRVSDAEGDIIALQGDLGALDTRVSDAESINTVQNAAISTEVSDRTAADTSLDSRVSIEESTRALADTSLTTRISDAESVNTVQTASITSLEAAIMQDFDMIEDILPGVVAVATAPANYFLSGVVQDNDETLVQVFVNGVKVRCTAASGNQVTVVAPYDVDATDTVTFLFQKE